MNNQAEDGDFAFGGGGFAKLYGDRLADSSLLECRVATRWVFLYMLARADAQGRFRCASVLGLARAAAVSVAEAEAAVAELEAPDPHSSSSDDEGRRLVRIPGGWRIVTYAKYRHYQSARQRCEADRKRRQRAQAAAEANPGLDPSPPSPLPATEGRRQKTDPLQDVQGPPADVLGHVPHTGRSSATARELATLTADPTIADLGDAWAAAFGRKGRQLGVLRAARTAIAAGYDAEDIKRVVRVVAVAQAAPERFPERGSIRWSVEHGKAVDPGYLLRPATLDRLLGEAEEAEKAAVAKPQQAVEPAGPILVGPRRFA